MNKFASGTFFVCVCFFETKNKYILIHIRPMRAGR